MPWIAGAIAVTGLYSARQAGEAAEEAGELQADAARSAAAESGRQFDITQEQLAPWREAGRGALTEQQALLGLSGPEAEQAAISRISESPAQQFLRARQQRALLRTAGATRMGGGNLLTALQKQAVGFGQQDIERRYGRLAELSGAGQRTAVQVGQFGQQAAQQAGQFGMQAAQATASGILGAQQAQASGLQSLVQAGGYYANRPASRPLGTAGVGA